MPVALCAQHAPQLTIHWDKTTVVSKSTPSLHKLLMTSIGKEILNVYRLLVPNDTEREMQ